MSAWWVVLIGGAIAFMGADWWLDRRPRSLAHYEKWLKEQARVPDHVPEAWQRQLDKDREEWLDGAA